MSSSISIVPDADFDGTRRCPSDLPLQPLGCRRWYTAFLLRPQELQEFEASTDYSGGVGIMSARSREAPSGSAGGMNTISQWRRAISRLPFNGRRCQLARFDQSGEESAARSSETTAQRSHRRPTSRAACTRGSCSDAFWPEVAKNPDHSTKGLGVLKTRGSACPCVRNR